MLKNFPHQTYLGRSRSGIRRQSTGFVAFWLCLLLPLHLTLAQALPSVNTSDDPLLRGFLSPPDSVKPRVWWLWMNGNITEEGIKLDLEWMHRVGLGGIQNFDAGYSTPQIVDRRLVFMTPPWQDAFRYTAMLADQLRLELAIAGSPGWSESGGPWVKSEEGMKKLVWTETQVTGGIPFTGKLPHPPTVIGPFQNVAIDRRGMSNQKPRDPVREVYADVAVIAYKLPASEQSMAELNPIVTTSAGAIDAKRLWDGDFAQSIRLPYGSHGKPVWIQVDFDRPQTVQSMSLGLIQDYSVFVSRHVGAVLQASADRVEFHTIALGYDTANQSRAGSPPAEETVTFAPVTARHFRLLLPTPPARQIPPAVASLLSPRSVPKEHQITEFVLHSTPRVDHFEQKAGFFLDAGKNPHPTRHVLPSEVVNKSEIIDVTSLLRPDGTLNWTPPAGHWAILRVGYSLLGITNHPASPEGTGLEVDKLDRAAVKAHMESYLGHYAAMLRPGLIGSHGLRAMVNDSWEAGPQNWTPELPTEFARRRGYDLRPWLPALTGRIINSAEQTDRFLWDFRSTLGDLLAENHYGQLAASLHERGMIHYGESHERSRAFIGDGMDAKRDDDIPMGAMWMPGFFYDQSNSDADIRESASVAHIYGQNVVAAESMTVLGVPGAAFAWAPDNLKPTVDREFADGANLIVPLSVHQPRTDAGPGVTLGPFGQWFTRNETWAEQAGPWVTYLSRSAYMLQQGHFVADVIYFYGQDSNITALYGHRLPPISEGYAFDFASAHALTKLSVQSGMLVTASGMCYRVLVLDPRTRWMSLDVLKQIAHLVEAGATVVGDKPQSTPGLPDLEQEFHMLADAVWGFGRGDGQHRYGKGRILSGQSLAQALVKLKLEPDFSYVKPRSDTTVWFVHRRSSDADLYFLNNRGARAARITATFRVTGKEPELWHADTGLIEPSSYQFKGDRTVMSLNLDPQDAVFVVFRRSTEQRERKVPQPVRHMLARIAGPWSVRFQSGRGAPDSATFSELKSWTANEDSRIKYFSGTASYETGLNAPAQWFVKGQSLEIDLGTVENVAEVLVNGQSAGIVWKPPFRTDITGLLQSGVNRLTIRVTNLWPNRLIGDKQPNAKSVAFTTFNPYSADSPLLDSGLLGPVTLLKR